MGQRGRQTGLAERIEIGERWSKGQNDPEIAATMGLSAGVVRKWRRKYQQTGRSGLVSRLGRPAQGALSQSLPQFQETVQTMRETHPGWGPLTILSELAKDEQWAKMKLPSRSRVAAFLKELQLTRKYERHSALPHPPAVQPHRPHEEWEVDAQGVIPVTGLGKVSIINIGDLFSRVKIDSWPCLNRSHPNTQDYQLVLRRAFIQYGLPERISFDHDSVFYDNTTASPFPTNLHLWLIALGIAVRFIEHAPPEEHSVIERSHQTVTNQAIRGQSFSQVTALQQSLTQRLDFLNNYFPSRSLGGQPPLVLWPQAAHSGRPYRLEWEPELLNMQRVYAYLAQGHWFRLTSTQGQFSLGGQCYNVGTALARQTLEITFEPQEAQFNILLPDGSQSLRLSPLALTKNNLMGELSPFLSFPVYQLALPFSVAEWRQLFLANHLTGTTL